MDKKIVGIVTIIDYDNYGNRLQNYAVQEILKDKGMNVITIKNKPLKISKEPRENLIKKVLKLSTKEIYSKISFRMKKRKKEKWIEKNRKNYENAKEQRINSFKEFTEKYIKETAYEIEENEIPEKLSSEFDYFVTGSDQVWNYNFRHGSSIDFLRFAPKEKRIALAPSFGVNKISPTYLENYRIWINEMEALSCREFAGSKLIYDLTGKEVPTLIDPTMMISKEKWISISKASIYKPKENYLLTYILGDLNKEKRVFITEFSKKNHLKVFNLADLSNLQGYSVGPEEFLDIIKDATVFFTDSFHGGVFSILFETPFVIFDREDVTGSMNSRLETLLNKFKLNSRFYSNIIDDSSIFEIDFDKVNILLNYEKEEFYKYISKCFS